MKGPAPRARVGPYGILETVASRAFSTTYRARHDELGRTVLLKTLNPSVSASSKFAQGLEREAKILASLHHEVFVSLLELGRSGDSIWLALEDTRGAPLTKVLERAGSLDAEPATAIAIEIARGLAHAHERGVILGSLRPDTIELSPEGGVKITELAGAHAARLPALPELLEGDVALATPGSLSPEQLLGEAITPRTDVFLLGVILYEMLAGTGPFSALRAGESGEGASGGGDPKDVAMRIRRGAPEPLRLRGTEAPRSLERAVMRCLAREPDDRFESAKALASALEESLAERTRAPLRVLVSRALAAAKLGDEIAPPGEGPASHAPPPVDRSLWPMARGYLLLFALIVAGALVIELGARDRGVTPDSASVDTGLTSASAGTPARGYVRALATPWAEVLIDGELIDTTPIGRPIPVTPGRHFMTFRHPNAPEEKRSIQVAAGQTVVVDVTMRIDRSARQDAGAGPKPSADDSP